MGSSRLLKKSFLQQCAASALSDWLTTNQTLTESLVAVASVLPDEVITNRDLGAIVDTGDEWIKSRTGIEERRRGSTTVQLAIDVARATLAEAGSDGEEVDLIIVATQTPDEVCPSTAARVQDALGLECGAFDLNSACSGWVYGVLTANGLLAGGMRSALVIGVDRMTKVTDYTDRSTAILFGDGAGAVLMRATDVPNAGILGFDVGTDGSKGEILGMQLGGNVYMKGSELFKVMVRYAVGSCERASSRLGLDEGGMSLTVTTASDLDLDHLLARISVRPPYFGYDRIEERAVGLLAAPVPQAAPVLPEGGPYQAGAAARHLAILGACSVAYRRDDDTRHHYLATRANYLRGARAADLSEGLTAEALGTMVGRKNATARTRLLDSVGRVVVTLDVEYVVVAARIFERLNGSHRASGDETAEGPDLQEWLAGGNVESVADGLRISLGPIPASVCAGHFPEHPAAPVAVVMDGLGHTAMRIVQERFDLMPDTPVVYEEGQVDAQGLAFAGQQLELDVRYRDLDSGVAVVEGNAIADGEVVGRGLFRICQVGGSVT